MLAEMEAKVLAMRVALKAKFREELNKKSGLGMKKILKNASDEELKLISETFLPEENAEICQAVYELIEERKKRISN